MITKDYSKGPRLVGKDYVLWKVQNMQESVSCGFEIKTKEICLWTTPIAFENILEGTYLHTGFEK